MNIADYWLFIGMDPALKSDWFGVCIHALPKKRTKPWLPYMIDLVKLRTKTYTDMWDALTGTDGILKPYVSFRGLQIDYTTEKGIADQLEQKFGEHRVLKTPFTAGVSGSKMQIANAALATLNTGYQWPDHPNMPDLELAENVRILKQQVIEEQTKPAADGSVKFYHKIGKHNDLLHAWMLSIDICRQYILAQMGMDGTHVMGQPPRKQFGRYDGLLGNSPEGHIEDIIRGL